MGDYLFRFPDNMPLLDFESLRQWLGGRHERMIGATVTIKHLGDGTGADGMLVHLYETLIAIIYEPALGIVWFLPEGDEGHIATTHWLSAIARHNGIAGGMGRRRRRKKDGPGIPVARGEAGVLVLWGRGEESPVVNTQYPVDLERRRKMLNACEREKLVSR